MTFYRHYFIPDMGVVGYFPENGKKIEFNGYTFFVTEDGLYPGHLIAVEERTGEIFAGGKTEEEVVNVLEERYQKHGQEWEQEIEQIISLRGLSPMCKQVAV